MKYVSPWWVVVCFVYEAVIKESLRIVCIFSQTFWRKNTFFCIVSVERNIANSTLIKKTNGNRSQSGGWMDSVGTLHLIKKHCADLHFLLYRENSCIVRTNKEPVLRGTHLVPTMCQNIVRFFLGFYKHSLMCCRSCKLMGCCRMDA